MHLKYLENESRVIDFNGKNYGEPKNDISCFSLNKSTENDKHGGALSAFQKRRFVFMYSSEES